MDKQLTKREKLTIYLVIFLIKVIKPFAYSNELDKALNEVGSLLKDEEV